MSAHSDLAAGLAVNDLVPGHPEALNRTAQALRAVAAVLDEAGVNLSRVEVGEWTGDAADSFHARFDPEASRWTEGAANLERAAITLDFFADTLAGSKSEAARARSLWDRGDAATTQARAEHRADLAASRNAGPLVLGAPTPDIAFVDPGQALRDEAVRVLEGARAAVEAQGSRSAATINEVAELAPTAAAWPGAEPTTGDKLEAMRYLAGRAGEGVLNSIYNKTVVPAVNLAANVGEAEAEDPLAVAEMGAGAALMTLGGVGFTGGSAATATVVGAPVGVPLATASAAAVAAGAGLAGHGAGKIFGKALSDREGILEARKFGSSKPPHRAEMHVSRNGEPAVDLGLQSGRMTPEEAALGFPRASLATHTESRGLRALADDLKAGDDVRFEGQYPPCSACKGAMNKYADEFGVKIEYRWGENVWKAGSK